MTDSIAVVGTGAVTSVGVTSAQTCAAIRAGIAGFRETVLATAPFKPVVAAAVPSRSHLKRTRQEWLVALAVRAITECYRESSFDQGSVALLLTLPETHNGRAGLTTPAAAATAREIIARVGNRFHPASRFFEHGHAGALIGLGMARELLKNRTVAACIVGGVDSLLNRADWDRLSKSGRLRDQENPQGLIPGEGAAFLSVCRASDARGDVLAELLGLGFSNESDTVRGDRYSVGNGLREAMEGACRDATHGEPTISFRVSDMNGERYRAWESLFACSRFYRTRRRECFPIFYPAASVGDLGAAASALATVFAASAIKHGYAPGPIGMCEAGSDDGARAACLLGPASGARVPPFRDKKI